MRPVFVAVFLAFVLVACSEGNTAGSAVEQGQDKLSALQEELSEMDAVVAAKQRLLSETEAALARTNETVRELKEELAEKQELIDQQKQILKEFDNERRAAVQEAEECLSRVEELEEKNRKLSEIVKVCQEDLSE